MNTNQKETYFTLITGGSMGIGRALAYDVPEEI